LIEPMENIRSFIAIEIPEEVKGILSRLQESLKAKSGSYIKWVDAWGIHITIKFLGNVASQRIPQIIQTLFLVGRGIPSFSLELGEPGVFPNIQRPQVIWVGLKGEVSKLSQLQRQVERALIPLGFSPEARPFTPHLTLGRVREGTPPQERKRLGSLFTTIPLEKMPSFSVESMVLMKSQLTPKGAIYTPLASISLGGLSNRRI